MLITTVFTALYAVMCVFLFNYAVKKNYVRINANIVIVCAASIALRIAIAYNNLGHSTDMGCFSAWADMLYKNGFVSFYNSDSFTDYPPGYMYILRLVGWVKSLYSYTAGQESIIIKLPAMLFDILMGAVVYYTAKKSLPKEKAQIIALIYIFSPAVIINSAVWGQVDSVYLIFVVLALIYLEKNIILSFMWFAAAVIFKPQALIFTPVFLFASWEYLRGSGKKSYFAAGVIGALVVIAVMIIPFGVKSTLLQYTDTVGSYPYASVNAFNLWGMLGLNWRELNPAMSVIGYVFILIICVAAGVIYFKGEEKSKYFTTASFLCFAVYMLSVRMHERYAFCAAALMLTAFCRDKKRSSFVMFIFLTLSQVINVAWVYFVYEKNPSACYQSVFINIFSAVNVLLLGFMLYSLVTKRETSLFSGGKMRWLAKRKVRFTASDVIAMAVITVLYSVVAFYGLGDRNAPETKYTIEKGERLLIELDREYELSELCLFLGVEPIDDKNELKIQFYDIDGNISNELILSDCEVFAWHFEPLEEVKAKSIVMIAPIRVTLRETAFFDSDGNAVTPKQTPAVNLFDESGMVPERESNLNGTYFDEVYHARTAYEFLNGSEVYEWTHPPLGKIFIALGIKLFGMNPFGWRFAGTVFGIFMIPFVYMFSKKLFSKLWLASAASIVFAFDFMHFVQTRIATIDVYITFFVILMYYFMYSYYNMNFYKVKLSKTFVPLLLCGISFGLGTASKWTGIYAGAGLCVIFFITLNQRFKEYLNAVENPTEKNSVIVSVFKKNTLLTLLFCVLSFIIIPLIIYLLSYIPFIRCDGGGLMTIIKNQTDMFVYHSRTVLDSTHPYSSKWYEWIIMKRPIWYYSHTIHSNLKEGISAFGNPLVWWTGIPAVLFTVYRAFVKKDRTAVFLTIGYFAQLIPWFFVDRVVFIYHYFPCVPFVVLCIAYCINRMYGRMKSVKYISFAYAGAVVLMFAMFYPVLAGIPIDPAWVDRYLRWFSSWVLI